MAKSKTITLKKANKVFTNIISRLRAHDIIKISVDKKQFLTLKEQDRLHSIANEIRGGLFGMNCDILARRKGRLIRFTKF